MRAHLVALLLFLFSCRDHDEGGLRVPAPPQVRRALSVAGDLGARAFLVPNNSVPGEAITLTRGADGVSFSGFIGAGPGNYTIEIAFDGVAGGRRLFLGRWASDVFTVVAGDVASAVFSKPLDTIGRPEDQGDADGDQFGNLDELLWATNLESADSDGDGLVDGRDCDPADGAKNFTVLGTIEDCDGDGFLRSDLTYREPGTDCDDRDAAIAECTPDDTRGPEITVLEPLPGSTVGCHRKIRARISDPSGVAESSVARFEAGNPSLVESLRLYATGESGVVETRELNVATSIWMEDGPELFVIRARDNRGNTSTSSLTLSFDLDVPVVTMTPQVIGARDLPFDVTVNASAPSGIASIRLMLAPLASSVDRAAERELGSASTSPAVFTIDPSALSAGDYAIYPVVVDTIGNRLDPDSTFSLDGGPAGEFVTDPYYICVFDSGPQKVPVRTLIAGGGNNTIPPAKMKDHYAEAVMLAAQRDPNAVLIEIRGWGLENDGTIQLGQITGGDGKWWRYEFFNFTDDRHIEVTWYSAAEMRMSPEVVVTENSPFGGSYRPVGNPSALVDSDVAVQAYRAASGGRCPALTGLEADVIRYESDQPFSAADVIRIEVGANIWKATATQPITELWACP